MASDHSSSTRGDATGPRPVIAIDGPAASGKGTIARRLADHYAFAYLDTGLLYRGVAYLVLAAGADPSDPRAAAAAAAAFNRTAVANAPLRTPEVGAAASVVAANPEVRAALVRYQRDFAANPPALDASPPSPDANPPSPDNANVAAGAVLDGRDIGTVICPNADAKIFVTASPEVRARRRWLELVKERPELDEADVLRDIAIRDARDAERTDAPLARAADAELLDTTSLSIDAAVEAARLVVDCALRRRGG